MLDTNLEPAIVGILVGPIPLVTDHLDGEIGRRRRILRRQQPDRRDRNRHQDQHRNQRPDDFQQGVMRGARRLRIGAAAEAEHGVGQQDQHEQADHQAHQQQRAIVEAGGALAIGGELLLQAKALGGRHADARGRCGRGEGRRRRGGGNRVVGDIRSDRLADRLAGRLDFVHLRRGSWRLCQARRRGHCQCCKGDCPTGEFHSSPENLGCWTGSPRLASGGIGGLIGAGCFALKGG